MPHGLVEWVLAGVVGATIPMVGLLSGGDVAVIASAAIGVIGTTLATLNSSRQKKASDRQAVVDSLIDDLQADRAQMRAEIDKLQERAAAMQTEISTQAVAIARLRGQLISLNHEPIA